MSELSVYIPFVSLLIAAASFYFARKHDTKSDAERKTEVVLEIRAMRDDVLELKSDMKALRAEHKQDHDDIVMMKSRMDTEFKTMWVRIDELKTTLAQEQERRQES